MSYERLTLFYEAVISLSLEIRIMQSQLISALQQALHVLRYSFQGVVEELYSGILNSGVIGDPDIEGMGEHLIVAALGKMVF